MSETDQKLHHVNVPIDADTSSNTDEILILDQETTATTFVRGRLSNKLRQQQRTTFDYIVKHTDYFLTPHTPIEVVQDFKKIFNFYIKPANIYTYLERYINYELTRIKMNKYTARGTISKNPRVSFIKTTHLPASYTKPKDQAIIQVRKKNTEKNLETDTIKKAEETDAINQLYDVIVANPGKRPAFYLTLFDIRAKLLESRLQKLLDEKKIEYRGKLKSGGYWAVS